MYVLCRPRYLQCCIVSTNQFKYEITFNFETRNNSNICLTESTLSRDRDSDDDWEIKEQSRTISVKFTEEPPIEREVSLCCCPFIFKGKSCFKASRTLEYNPLCRNICTNTRYRCRELRCWFRNVLGIRTRQRTYLALSSILVALE